MGRIRRSVVIAVTVAAVCGIASAGFAQPAIVEGHLGRTWFLDERAIPHVAAGGSARVFVTSRIAIGPEVMFMKGPGEDRDWFFTGNLTFDAGSPTWRIRPYILAGAGMMRTTLSTGIGRSTASEFALTYGAGARVMVRNGWFIAPEFRQGWEPHWGVVVSVGVRR